MGRLQVGGEDRLQQDGDARLGGILRRDITCESRTKRGTDPHMQRGTRPVVAMMQD
jgi:hypothetical protein